MFLQFVIVTGEVAKPQLYLRMKLSMIWLTENIQIHKCIETLIAIAQVKTPDQLHSNHKFKNVTISCSSKTEFTSPCILSNVV